MKTSCIRRRSPSSLVHLACFGAIWSGITWQALVICIVLYWGRIFAIGAGYHRYFSHRAYSTSRWFQFVLALMCQSTSQKSVLWWAQKHRHHHLFSDTEFDVHSPRHKGFFYSHVGWIFTRRHDAHRPREDRRFRLLSRADVAAPLRAGARRSRSPSSAFSSPAGRGCSSDSSGAPCSSITARS